MSTKKVGNVEISWKENISQKIPDNHGRHLAVVLGFIFE